MKKSDKRCIVKNLARSACPIANTLELLGDKWTLLVVRDLLFLSKRLYGELLQSEEAYPTNILADRLRRLEEAGLITKTPYQHKPIRYEYHLTNKGNDLFPILKEIIVWGNKYIQGTTVPPPGLLDYFSAQTQTDG